MLISNFVTEKYKREYFHLKTNITPQEKEKPVCLFEILEYFEAFEYFEDKDIWKNIWKRNEATKILGQIHDRSSKERELLKKTKTNIFI